MGYTPHDFLRPYIALLSRPNLCCKMSYSRNDRKRIYSSWYEIFSSYANSHLAKTKAIRKVVERHRPTAELFEPDLIGILQSLLRDGIFQWGDTTNAQREFPELFNTRPRESRMVASKAAEAMTTQMNEPHQRLLQCLEQ